MTLPDFKPQMRVAYIPGHVGRASVGAFPRGHAEIEYGTVSSIGTVSVFVKFHVDVIKHGWLGATSKSCDPGDLVREEEAR